LDSILEPLVPRKSPFRPQYRKSVTSCEVMDNPGNSKRKTAHSANHWCLGSTKTIDGLRQIWFCFRRLKLIFYDDFSNGFHGGDFPSKNGTSNGGERSCYPLNGSGLKSGLELISGLQTYILFPIHLILTWTTHWNLMYGPRIAQ